MRGGARAESKGEPKAGSMAVLRAGSRGEPKAELRGGLKAESKGGPRAGSMAESMRGLRAWAMRGGHSVRERGYLAQMRGVSGWRSPAPS